MPALTAAQSKLVEDNQRLVHCAVALYIRRYPHLAHVRDDLMQEGMMGLCRAALKFKPELGYKFSTNALNWVRALVSEHGRHLMNPARAPNSRSSLNDKAVYLVRGAMPLHEASEWSNAENEVDGKRLYARAKNHLTSLVGQRNSDIFFEGSVFEAGPPTRGNSPVPAIAKKHGMSTQRVREIRQWCGKKLKPWAERIRNEA